MFPIGIAEMAARLAANRRRLLAEISSKRYDPAIGQKCLSADIRAMTSSRQPRIATRNLSFTALALIAWCAAPAAADGDGKTAVATAGDAAAPPDPGDPHAGASTAATATSEPAAPAARYPRAVIERPLTLPAGV